MNNPYSRTMAYDKYMAYNQGSREAIFLAEHIITHVDSQYGFINRLHKSPDWQRLKEERDVRPSDSRVGKVS